MIFDEWAILGGPLEDAHSIKTSSPRKSPLNKPEILSNRAKTIGKPSLTSRPNIVQRYSSDESPKSTPKKIFDVDALLTPQPGNFSSKIEMAEDPGTDSDDTDPLTSGESGFIVDSKNDFMSALTASQDDEPNSSSLKSTSQIAENPFKSAAHGPAGNRRRWMTLPSNALATIQENDGEDTRVVDGALGQRSSSSKKGDLIDTELILIESNAGEKKKTRQMRVPQVNPNGDIEPLPSFLDNIVSPTDKKQDKEVNDPPFSDKQRTLTDDGDIEIQGTAFLDAISKSMGFGHG